MNNKDYFDEVLKSAINDSLSNIEPSRDVFNEAWNKKEQRISKKRYFSIQHIRKAVLIPACCIVLAVVGTFTFSPEARVAAQEIFRTIFIPDESGNIVERSEDEKIEQYNIGGVRITESNRKEMEERLGFIFNLPERIGEYSTENFDGYSLFPRASISIYDIKYTDTQDMKDKFMKAIDDDKTFEELKDYNMKRFVSSSYVDNKGHKFYLYLSKAGSNSKINIVKEVNIDNIKCTIVEKSCTEYNKKINDNYCEDDITKEPISIDKHYYIKWNYDDIEYSIYIEKNSDVDAAIEFAREYIKILKQK